MQSEVWTSICTRGRTSAIYRLLRAMPFESLFCGKRVLVCITANNMRSPPLFILLISLLLIASCASPPEPERVRAQDSLAKAEETNASLYAGVTFQEGRAELERGETEVVIQLSRPRVFRRFVFARLRFQKADELFRASTSESLTRQVEFRQEAKENLEEFERIGSSIENHLLGLRGAPERKQIDKVILDLNSLREEVPRVQEMLKSGNYNAAHYAASNLRVRATLLFEQTSDFRQRQIVASIH